ncbi:nitrite/sulfite reductase [Rothia amarae]|uniref:nitrite/sulfite reductase n=1 Tax=Rothia amarae TaxID=169480 RepID=UPI0011A7DF78
MAKSLTQQDKAAATKKPTPRSAKPNGQWKIDGTEPLNDNERFKLEDNGLNVRERIENEYSKEGFDSIPADDLRGRMRWWGMYTQRKQGIDGGRTAKLSPEELEDHYFMLRVRIDGGQLTTEQARVIGEISQEFARDTADITDRQNIQLHWVQIEDAPEIWRRLEAVGLSTTEACGDVPRVILGSPVAGVDADELIDPTVYIEEIKEKFIGDPDLSNLPRKFKTAITGNPSHDVVHEINDISLVAVNHPELGVGFSFWVGGGLSTNPKLAENVGVFVKPEQVTDVWLGTIKIFRDYGYRRLRNRARMKFLINDWGVEKFREVLENEYLGYSLADGIEMPAPTKSGDHVGVFAQKDGKNFVGLNPTVGRISGTTLVKLAELAEAAGSKRVRTTPYQKILVLDVPDQEIDALLEGVEELGLTANPSIFRRNTIACTGIEYCKLAIVDTKKTAIDAIDQLEKRLEDVKEELPQQFNVFINGCPNACARTQTADIGLKGQIITTDEGEQVPGFQVHLGGTLADYLNAGSGNVGKTVRGLKVASADLVDYLERVLRKYLDTRSTEEETFAVWAQSADEELLV